MRQTSSITTGLSPAGRGGRMRRAGLAAVAVVGTAAPAAAATVPFTEALYAESGDFVTDPSHFDYVHPTNSAPASPVSVSYANGDANGSVTASASANLTTGQLKIQGSSSAPITSTYPPYTQANAIFGDGFTTKTASGQPFAWTAGTAAQFTLNLGGTITSDVNGAPSSLSAAGGGAFLDLQILKPGTVNPNTRLFGSPNAIANYFYTFDGTTAQIYYTDPAGDTVPLPVTTAYANLPSVITQNFDPGGDFDWTVLFGLSGQPPAGADFDIDLAHTLTVDYAAPAGAVTKSASGLFANISNLPSATVPEPAGWTVALAGLGVLAVARRRPPSGSVPG